MNKEEARKAEKAIKDKYNLGNDYSIDSRRYSGKDDYRLFLYAYDQRPGPIGEFPENVLFKVVKSFAHADRIFKELAPLKDEK
jgi:hypothetical protein